MANKDSKTLTLTEDELEQLIDRAIKKTLFTFGIKVDTHEDIQEVRRDFRYVHDLRVASDIVKTHGLKTVVGILVTAGCGAILLGAVSFFNNQ